MGLLALRTGTPVVPFGVVGSAEVWPIGRRVPRPGRITLFFAAPRSVESTAELPVPDGQLTAILAGVRDAILGAMRSARALFRASLPAWRLKGFQVALAALVVLPLAGFLSMTANPSLDQAGEAADAAHAAADRGC